ncbi:MAG: response regulator, partial [Myxococcota bacterium]
AGDGHDVVIMDLVVPGGLGGRDAIARLREIDPDVRAIVSSGFAHDPVMSSFRRHGFDAVLTKPYGLEDLLRTLDDVLRA